MTVELGLSATGCRLRGMTWVQRKALGEALERRVGQELATRGWTVNRYGQGALSENIRAAMRSGASALRWNPDLIAARGDRVVTVDCKAQQSGRSTSWHAIECAAVKAHIRFIAMFETRSSTSSMTSVS